MRLTTALNEYKRQRDERFPEEARTTEGAFSGHGDRLVHVSPGGALKDYSAALSGLNGIDRSRLGIETPDRTYWLEDLNVIRQHYYRETRLVETEYDANGFTVHQFDLTLGRAHVTHVELRGAVPSNSRLVAFLTLAPEGREASVGALIHEEAGPEETQALEVYHRREHDYVTASTGLDEVRGQRPERFDEILSDDPVDFPRGGVEPYDETRLSGNFVVTAPLEREGRGARTTLVSQLADHAEIDRADALSDLRNCAMAHASADDLRSAARDRTTVDVPESVPRAGLVRSDLRVLDLLEGSAGGHIAGPEFDPFYANSGGYGYVWFRDDAAVSRRLMAAGDHLELDVTDELLDAARFYCETQLPDGTWPHRVWATDGSLAPGWANAKVERKPGSSEYQADQTATVTAFLATLLAEGGDGVPDRLRGEIEAVIDDAVDALADSLAENGLPARCQNVWENAVGQFTHTAAAFLQGYAAVANAPLDEDVQQRAKEGARTVLEGLDHVWDEEAERYGIRLIDDQLDDRLDAATLLLTEALIALEDVDDVTVSDQQVERLSRHVDAVLTELYREPGDGVAGIVRYEDDRWRTDDQVEPKVWSVTTGLGVIAASQWSSFLRERRDAEASSESPGEADAAATDGGDAVAAEQADAADGLTDPDALLERATELYELLGDDGPFSSDAGYLAEQVFDDGSLDSATPLGWSHGLRLHATALLDERDALPVPTTEPTTPPERPRWTTGEKYALCTPADHETADPSRVWFTLTNGALTEARFPRIDVMNLRTLDYLVRSRETGHTVRTHTERGSEADEVTRRVEPIADDALLYRHVFEADDTARDQEWTLTVEYAVDPEHDAIVADVDFEAADDGEYDVFAVADLALANTGNRDRGLRVGESGNYNLLAREPAAYTTDVEDPLLVDEDGNGYSVAMALAAADRFDWATVGVAGSDHLADLFGSDELPEERSSVDDETVVLVGRVGAGSVVEGTVAAGFARKANTAAALGEANGALERGFETVRDAYVDTWRDALGDTDLPVPVADEPALAAQYRTALMSLVAVEDKTYHGASIASPSVPWGEAVSADEPKGYGYNFVWSRDLYQVFSVFNAVGFDELAREQLEYIYEYQQDEEGFIPQNTYVNGITRWGGEQMDNISYPQVMAYQLAQSGVTSDDADYEFENVRRSADYVVRNGPSTAQERWEEEAGYSPSSIAAEISGLTCAGALAADAGETAHALVWFALADNWAGRVEEWTATETGTDRHEETPYYVRITRDGDPDAGHLRRLANDGPTLDERDIIDAGFLDLVRLGIRPADDQVIENSVHQVDETIRVDFEPGPGFYRYNGDGYGERATGDKGGPWSVQHKGKGRLWPLLTGERGEYELLAPDTDLPAEDCLRTMQHFANSGRMIAEQVWDREHGTDYDWSFGEGTGSATPLAWSMAQYVRLALGLAEGEPVETPEIVARRYRDLGLHETDGPDLRVDARFHGDQLIVAGETEAETVAIKTESETRLVEPTDGNFEVTVEASPTQNRLTVAAAESGDLTEAATTVHRLTL